MATKVKIRDASLIPSITGTEVLEIDNGGPSYYKTTPNQLSSFFQTNIEADIEKTMIHKPVASIVSLKAIDTTLIVDGVIITISGLGTWQFIKASTVTADDITVVAPTTGGGRWIKQTIIEDDGTLKLLKDLNANSKNISGVLTLTSTTTNSSNIITDSLTEKTLGNGIIIPTGIFVKYQTHPIFTIDTQLVDKKYVDDHISNVVEEQHEVLVISFPGQVSFSLLSSPLAPTKSIVTLNGQVRTYTTDYTISGNIVTWNNPAGVTLKTTDDFQIWYDLTGGGIFESTDVTLGGATPSDSVVPTQKAAKTYIDNNHTTISTDTSLGGVSPSDILVPSQKAAKIYIDNSTKNLPKFSTSSVTYSNALGDSTLYTVRYSASAIPALNIGNYFNSTTHRFVSPYDCWMNFYVTVSLTMPPTPHSHTYIVCQLRIVDTDNNLVQIIIVGDGNTVYLTNTFNNIIMMNASASIYMAAGYEAFVLISTDGTTNDIAVNGLGGGEWRPTTFGGEIVYVL